MFGKFARKGEGASHVQLVTPDAQFAQRFRDVLGRSGDCNVEAAPNTIGAIEQNGLAHPHTALLVAEIDTAEPQELATLERVMRRHANGARVIVVADQMAGDAARVLLRLQVADWLPKTAPDEELLHACRRALEPDAGAGSGLDAAVYAYLPAAGGVGNTLLAIQSAFLLNAKSRPGGTCLVDLNFQSGAVADYMDLAPNLQLDEVVPRPERLDAHLLEVMLSQHDSGLAVLAAANALRDYTSISDEVVARLLDLTSVKFERVVIDMPRVWLSWTESVLRGCNKVFVTTEMTVPGLRQAQRLVKEIDRRFGEDVEALVIVNRFRTRLIGGGINALRRKDAEALFGDRLAGFVSEDYRLAREAIDRGVPLRDIRKRNNIDRDLSQILFGAPA